MLSPSSPYLSPIKEVPHYIHYKSKKQKTTGVGEDVEKLEPRALLEIL